MEKYLTKQAYEKLRKELRNLETTKRREIAQQLKHAASFGDLSENAAYNDAKDAKSFLEGRITELRNLLFKAKIIEKEKTDCVQIGSKITVESENETVIFEIVPSIDVNASKGKISCESPLGKAFLNKKTGNKVKVETPMRQTEYKIIKIE